MPPPPLALFSGVDPCCSRTNTFTLPARFAGVVAVIHPIQGHTLAAAANVKVANHCLIYASAYHKLLLLLHTRLYASASANNRRQTLFQVLRKWQLQPLNSLIPPEFNGFCQPVGSRQVGGMFKVDGKHVSAPITPAVNSQQYADFILSSAFLTAQLPPTFAVAVVATLPSSRNTSRYHGDGLVGVLANEEIAPAARRPPLLWC
ncbi:hypothetical protein PC117_g21842 [Phytophthora cactorum]|uniref:Uncharacterized protein n=2 Tax=Phytophthora cactorum TaxID=29920 RepID=A0A8T1BJ73_9STRA|nr:hypothetical protein PC117_g21842 [Phytophthora cactorum]